MNIKELKAVCPYAKEWVLLGIEDNWDLFEKYEVTTPLRLAHCLAQLAHESAGFRTTEEYASGRAYEGRRDLGNTEVGDGTRYKGRGLIQLTGRYNYRKYGELLGIDIESSPELVRRFPLAMEVSLLYWKLNGLNELADQDKVRTITRRINGGFNGIADRKNYLNKFKRYL